MKQLIVIETIRAKKDKFAELEKALLAMVPLTLKEKGCLHYEIAKSETSADTFLVLMRWDSSTALDKHNDSEHIQAFVRKYDNILYDEVHETHWWTC